MFRFLRKIFTKKHCCMDCHGCDRGSYGDGCDPICFISVKEVVDWVTGDKVVFYKRCSELNYDGHCPHWYPEDKLK